MNRKNIKGIFLVVILAFSLPAVLAVANESSPEKKVTKKDAPKMEHAGTIPGELCVGCHMEYEGQDPESTTPRINNKHEVCNRCHLEDGSMAEDGHCGCEDVSDPMDCEQCHTDPAMGDNPSAKDMNDLCLACH